MTAVSKRQKRHQQVVRTDLKPVDEALAFVKQQASTKFRESVDVAINLGIDASKSDQNVRGSTVLPNGTGKVVKVAVFAQGDNVAKAKAAGADVVGFEDLAERMKGGDVDFDVVIATPDAMRIVGQLGRVLGPRGLMPNPKSGTVTTDVAKAVREVKAGKVEYRIDKGSNIHVPVGKISFQGPQLEENVRTLIHELFRVKPASAKGKYLRSAYLCSTHGPAVKLDEAELGALS